MGVCQWFHYWDEPAIEKTLAYLAELGCTRLRTGISWADFHRPQGRQGLRAGPAGSAALPRRRPARQDADRAAAPIADVDDAANTTVCWSYEHNGGSGSYVDGASYPLAADLVEPGSSVIVAEVTYDYEPIIFDYFVKTAFPLKETLFLKPRLSSYVEYNGASCF